MNWTTWWVEQFGRPPLPEEADVAKLTCLAFRAGEESCAKRVQDLIEGLQDQIEALGAALEDAGVLGAETALPALSVAPVTDESA